MKAKLEIHPIQADILMYLLFHQDSRFSQINENHVDTDSFTFHLKSLFDAGLIEKNDTTYILTIKGKEFANRFDTVKSEIERQAKLGVVVIAVKEEKGQQMYLMQKRLKHPFFGYLGFITGKITWGETMYQTAARELEEETGLHGRFQFIGMEHKMDYAPDNHLLEDKFFQVFRVTDITGSMKVDFKGGKNFWATREEIIKTKDKFDDVPFLIQNINSKYIFSQENKFIVSGY
jgi:hypothetical protein